MDRFIAVFGAARTEKVFLSESQIQNNKYISQYFW